MSEFVCEVVRLPKFSRHPNADTLNIVSIWGYTTVFSDDNNFKEGDLVVYVPVDAMVPMKAEWEFLGTSANSHRIKAKKLRGIFSQGLLIKAPEGAQVGQDVATQLGITKYEEPEQEDEIPSSNSSHPGYYHASSWWQRALPNTLRKYLYLWFGFGKREPATEKCPFFFPVYTDIENVLGKYGKALPEGEEVILVEKAHGSNFRTVFSHTPPKHLSWWARRSWKPRLWVGSHNQIKAKTKKGKGNYWWQVAETYQLAERLQPYPDLVFFGEIYGWNVQDLKYNAQPDQLFFRVFDIFDLKGGRYLDYDSCCQIVETAKLEMMPTLYRGPWNLETLRGLAEKDSQLAPGQLMEGFVVRPTREKVDEHGNRLIFKYISQRYRLRKGGTEKH